MSLEITPVIHRRVWPRRGEQHAFELFEAGTMQVEQALEIECSDAIADLVGQRREREPQEMWGYTYGEIMEVVSCGQGVYFQRPEWSARKKQREKGSRWCNARLHSEAVIGKRVDGSFKRVE